MEKDLFDLIPKDKFDNSGVEQLMLIDVASAEPILGKLLEWMQDINWPIAQEYLHVLPRFHEGLIPHIRDVFKTDDGIWKAWVLTLMEGFPKETIIRLQDDIKRIALRPTEDEFDQGADGYARDLLDMFDL